MGEGLRRQAPMTCRFCTDIPRTAQLYEHHSKPVWGPLLAGVHVCTHQGCALCALAVCLCMVARDVWECCVGPWLGCFLVVCSAQVSKVLS